MFGLFGLLVRLADRRRGRLQRALQLGAVDARAFDPRAFDSRAFDTRAIDSGLVDWVY